MKKLVAAASFLFSASAFASPMVITDDYWGGDRHSYTDVIGAAAQFDTFSMYVDIDANTKVMTVDISTNFGTSGGLGSFTGYTNTTQGQGNGIGFGDLFLSSTGWNPNTTGTNYEYDNNVTGTKWDYGVSLADRWDGTGTAATLYKLNGATNNDNAYLSDDFLSAGTYRNGQEVAVDTGSTDTVALANDASMVASAGHVVFTLDLTGTDLEFIEFYGLHWNMTCGNDTIEGQYDYPVPEPTSLAIMLLGLACLGGASLRRRKIQPVEVFG
ncbi:MAG: hypothetical protein ACJAVI_000178 [Candidatus Azotimanducaceae bacterium]|jgi:hypothetical protein